MLFVDNHIFKSTDARESQTSSVVSFQFEEANK